MSDGTVMTLPQGLFTQQDENLLPYTASTWEMKDLQGQVQRQPQVSSTRTGDWLLEHEGWGTWSQLTR